MSKKANPTLIGLFTLVGLLITFTALVLFGAGKFFAKSYPIILYFENSAYGLLVGSEVRFGGVRIGRVTSIQVIIDEKLNRKIIPVVVEMTAKDLLGVGLTTGGKIDFETDEGVKKAVADGLRARMKQQSLVTDSSTLSSISSPIHPSLYTSRRSRHLIRWCRPLARS